MTDPPHPPDWDLDEHRRRYRACWSAFALAATSTALMAMDSAGWLAFFLTWKAEILRALQSPTWQWTAATAISFGFPLAALILARLWPVPDWRGRCRLLLLVGLGGVGLWALRHAHELGLAEAEVGHRLARDHAAILVRWAALALLAGLAADVLDHLGEPGARDARGMIWTLIALGAIVGGLLLLIQADWGQPWPLRRRPLRRDELALVALLSLSLTALRGLVALLSTVLCLRACRACARILLELNKQADGLDPFSPATPDRGGPAHPAGWD